jgi:HlyD family secretion protein
MIEPTNNHNAPPVSLHGTETPPRDGRIAPSALSARVRSLRLQTDGAAVKPRSAWLPWGLTVIALATAALFGWRAYRISPADAATAEAPAAAGSDSKPAGTTTDTPATTVASGEVVLDGKGYVIAAHQIQLSPQVGGEIIKLDPNFKEGAFYEKGQFLAQVDPVIYQAQEKSARALLQAAEVALQQAESGSPLKEIAAAKAQLNNLVAKLELARIDERNKRLAGIGTSRDDMEKAVTQVAVDTAAHAMQKQTVDKLEVALDEQRLTAKAQVMKAQGDLEQAQKNLKNCTIVAPTTGIILTKKAELGGYVNPLAFGGTGTAAYLCEMADLKDLEIELDIQERDISQVYPGQRCRIMPDSCQRDDEFKKSHPEGYAGVVSRRMPMANRSKGAITVRVKVEIPAEEQSGRYLSPDMGVLVQFLKK